MNASEWFEGWLKLHKSINPHHKFQDYESAGFSEIYTGWIEAFDREGIDRERATKASRLMQAEDKRGIFPEHHLSRLLKLARSSPRQVTPEEIEAEREAKLETRRKDQEEAQIKAGWTRLKPEVKERYRDIVRADHPTMCRFQDFIENLARHRWADTVRGIETVELVPAREALAVVRAMEVVAKPTAEADPTPGHLEFLASLTRGEREGFDAMTLARRQMILAPHANGFVRSLLSVGRGELASSRKRPEAEIPHISGEEPTRISGIEHHLEPAVCTGPEGTPSGRA